MPEFEHRRNQRVEKVERPDNWADFHRSIRHKWLLPFLYLDWLSQWAAYVLSKASFLELLEYLGSFSILIAVIFYFVEAPERRKMRHYQAWEVINSAQGKGGSGGRIEALHELNEDHVSLLGVDVADAFLQGVSLRDANLERANLASADMRNADLSRADLQSANLHFTNLTNANLSGAEVGGASFEDADLDDANLEALKNWKEIASIKNASIHNVRNAPAGFIDWAKAHGAAEEPEPTTRQ